MVLRLRLARVPSPTGAKRHRPFYNIVLAQARTARDSKPMEVLGTYDPIPKARIGADEGDKKVKDIKLDVARAKYWLGVGAQPTDTVWRILSMIGLLEPQYLPGAAQAERDRKGPLKNVRFATHVPRKQQLSIPAVTAAATATDGVAASSETQTEADSQAEPHAEAASQAEAKSDAT